MCVALPLTRRSYALRFVCSMSVWGWVWVCISGAWLYDRYMAVAVAVVMTVGCDWVFAVGSSR